VTHDEARERLHADPGGRTPELAAHLAACPECAAVAARLAAFDERLKRALAVPVPPAPAAEVIELRRPARPRRLPGWFALAAGGALAAIALGLVLSVYPRAALASAVVVHVEGEPDSWSTVAPVGDELLGKVLKRSHVRLAAGAPPVTYAASCTFRGAVVPHLVVKTDAGPVTVMLLAHEHVSRPLTIDESGYRGVIVPAGHGAIAVLARGTQPVPAALAAQAASTFLFGD